MHIMWNLPWKQWRMTFWCGENGALDKKDQEPLNSSIVCISLIIQIFKRHKIIAILYLTRHLETGNQIPNFILSSVLSSLFPELHILNCHNFHYVFPQAIIIFAYDIYVIPYSENASTSSHFTSITLYTSLWEGILTSTCVYLQSVFYISALIEHVSIFLDYSQHNIICVYPKEKVMQT